MTEIELWEARANAALNIVRAAERLLQPLRVYHISTGRTSNVVVSKEDFDKLDKAMEAYRAAARERGTQ